jgi:hypothetical protein
MDVELAIQNAITDKNMVERSLVRAAPINAIHNIGQKKDPMRSPKITENMGLKLPASLDGHHLGFGSLKTSQAPYNITTKPRTITVMVSHRSGLLAAKVIPTQKRTIPIPM